MLRHYSELIIVFGGCMIMGKAIGPISPGETWGERNHPSIAPEHHFEDYTRESGNTSSRF